MRITQGGLVGISNPAPIAKLDVGGDISTSGVIQVSGSALTAPSAIKGAAPSAIPKPSVAPSCAAKVRFADRWRA
jgi:hypothetical protein